MNHKKRDDPMSEAKSMGRGTFLSSFGARILYHILCILVVSSPADVSVDLTLGEGLDGG